MKMAVQNISKKDILIAQNLNKVETWGLCEYVWLGYPYRSAMKMTKKENYRKENDLHMKENELHMKFGKN